MADTDSESDEQFDRIVHEYYQAVEAGDYVDPEAFIGQHSDYEQQLRSFFADLHALNDLPGVGATQPTIGHSGSEISDSLVGGFTSGDRVTYIGQYRLLEEIARGGMGVVFKARQEKLSRAVALKMILSGPLASSSEIDRFSREARAAARLQHPNIVSVHEIGQHDGRYFFTMDYVESDSLADRLREGSLATDESAQLVETIARAMHYAHNEGVLHRDLKPANILIDSSGQPHITDFGLAKAQADADHETLQEMTRTGQILGTPSYMPPEQASGKSELVDVRSDVYSLGAILYACLVGRAPFVGESSIDTLRQVINEEPPRVRLLNGRVPRDLETICHKCLEKEPHRRYGTAAELADDVDRYLKGLPVLAKPTGRTARTWKWCKRRPDVAALLATLATALLVGVTTVGFLWRTAEARRWHAERSERDAKQHLYESWLREAQATRMARQSGYRDAVWSLLDQAENLDNVERDSLRVRREAVACLGDFVGLAPLSIDGPTLQGALGLSVFLDEKRLAVANAEGDVFVRDLMSGKETSRLFRYGNPVVAMKAIENGSGLILVDNLVIERWDRSERGNWIRSWRQDGGYPSLFMDVDIAGNWLAVIRGQRVALLDADDGRTVRSFSPGAYVFKFPKKGFLTTAISPDQRFIAAADHPGSVFVWETSSGELIRRIAAPGTGIPNLAFTADSLRLILGTDTGVVSFRSDDLSQWSVFQTEPIRSLSVSPDNRHLLIQSDAGSVQLWNLRTQRMEAQLANAGSGNLGGTSFSPGGSRFLASGTGLIRVWDIGGTPEKRVLRGHRDPVRCLAFHPSEPLLASGSHDRSVRFWDIRSGTEISSLHMEGRIQSIAFSPDGSHFAAATRESLRVWHVDRNGKYTVALSLDSNLPTFEQICFSDDGRWMAVCGARGPRIWKVIRGESAEPAKFELHKQFDSFFHTIEFDSTNRYLAMTRQRHRGWIDLKASNWAVHQSLALEFSSDVSANGRPGQFTVITSKGRFQDWILPSDELVPDGLPPRQLNSAMVSNSITSGLIAAKSGSSALELFDSSSHASIFTLADERSAINVFCWDKSGSKLAVGLADGSVSLWDVRTIDRLLKTAGLAKELSLFPGEPNTPTSNAVAEYITEPAELRKQTWQAADRLTIDQARVAQLLELWGIEPIEMAADASPASPDETSDPLSQQLHAAGGGIEASGAFATKLTEAAFHDLDERLRLRGYRVITVSPYNIGNTSFLAAGWIPSSLPVVLELDLTAEQLLETHAELAENHYRLMDAGGYLKKAGRNERFYAIWIEDKSYQAEQIIFPRLSRQQASEYWKELRFEHEPVQRQFYVDAERQWRSCEVWERFPQLCLPRWYVFNSDLRTLQKRIAQNNCDRLPTTYFKINRSLGSGELECSGVWRSDATDRLTRYCYALTPDSVISLGRAMLKAGFQPACLSLTSTQGDDQLAAAVWQRVDPEAKKVHPGIGHRDWPVVNGTCRVEGESLYHTTNFGRVFPQPMGTFSASAWSNDRQLLWIESPLGKYLDLAFEVTRKASYELVVRLTTAEDYGVVRLELDDQPLSDPIDLFRAGQSVSAIEVSLGKYDLDACAHRVRVHLVGSNKDAKPAHGFGIDYVQFVVQDSTDVQPPK